MPEVERSRISLADGWSLGSSFRILRVIYAGRLDPADQVAADLALRGMGGWSLRPGRPGDTLSLNDLAPPPDEPDLIWEPVVLTFHEID